MPGKEEVIRRVHQALEYEPRVNLHLHPVRIGYADGAVVLEGEVGDVATKKLALELAAAVVDALRLVLEMDPLVEAAQIRASCRNYVVTLDGFVRTEAERRQAERDAWCLFAVDRVVNRIEVRA
jgi:osmotically-inducible protein OsmY